MYTQNVCVTNVYLLNEIEIYSSLTESNNNQQQNNSRAMSRIYCRERDGRVQLRDDVDDAIPILRL